MIVHWPKKRDVYQIGARPRPCLIAFSTHGKQYHSLSQQQPISEDCRSGRMESEGRTKKYICAKSKLHTGLEMFSHHRYDIVVPSRDTYCTSYLPVTLTGGVR